MRRRDFLADITATGLTLSASSPAGSSAPAADSRPNFLIIMSDQHSPHVLGCYGDSVVQTPNLDRLAGEGVLFEHAYDQSPVCVPAKTSLLTGLHPYQHRTWANGDMLASDISTFAHSLGAAGYDTTLAGHMHFLGPDQQHGFEHLMVGVPDPRKLPPYMLVGAQCDSKAAVTLAGPGSTSYNVFSDQVADATAGLLRDRAKSGGKPFCILAGMLLPHPPFICSPKDWNYYRDRVTLPPAVPPGYYEKLHPAIQAWRRNRGIEDLSPAEIRSARAAYYGMVAQLDRAVGRILGALRETGLDRNTVVIYSTDHGEMAGENGMWWKFNFYEGSVSVPLIMSWPGHFPAGRRVREIVSHIDVRPTIEELSGRNMGVSTGKSLLPLLEEKPVEWANEAFSEYPINTHNDPSMRMVRKDRWKLVHFDGMRPQLFDMEADPHEFHDLGDDPAHAEIRDKLHARVLEGWSSELYHAHVARLMPHRRIIQRWTAEAKPPSARPFSGPADVNVFLGNH